MDYPDTFLRGLSSENSIVDGILSAAAFQFHFETMKLRNGCAVNSIGWEDDGSVVDLLNKQEKKDSPGSPQFKVGLARFKKDSIDYLMKLPAFRDVLSYDREPMDDNPYHGNLLISSASTEQQRKILPGYIAVSFSEILLRPKDEPKT